MQMKKYPVIYADPPWQYRVYSKKGLGRSAESHYPTMGIDEIRALPVAELAEKDCALFLWVTVPCLLEGLSVLQAWGFQYKTIAFVWIKQNKKADSLFWGMGYWTRSNAEFCILATRGSPKPQEARERIVQLMGDVPRIELFARQKTPGWDVGGNEVESDIEMESRKEERDEVSDCRKAVCCDGSGNGGRSQGTERRVCGGKGVSDIVVRWASRSIL